MTASNGYRPGQNNGLRRHTNQIMQMLQAYRNVFVWNALIVLLGVIPLTPGRQGESKDLEAMASPESGVSCDCILTQSGNTYPISALLGDQSASSFYSYGIPDISSANTGLELPNTMVLFTYQDTTTGVVSLFIILDIANDNFGGEATAEVNCLPPSAFVALADDAGELNGVPPLITGDWFWSPCCTDGGIIEDVGCDNTFNVDLLVSNGIDSIIWLTGDINNPDHILLNMNGDYITIDCGGGVCCPIGFDTEILVTDATCPDTPNGSIDINPEDGTHPFFYNWSNGATTEDISGLLPGSYLVTVTDANGCSEILNVLVDVSPGEPSADPAEIIICSENTEASFDLTAVEDIVSQGSGFTVLWFINPDLTGPILTPSDFVSGSTTVYAVVDNGSCLSDPVPVVLEILLAPVGMPATLHACEDQNAMAVFDLTNIGDLVSGGLGSVSWYLDPDLSLPISDPTAFLSFSTTIYAIVNDGTCLSDPVEIELIVDLKPSATGATLNACGDAFGEAIFDLTSVENAVSDGIGTVEWFEDMDLTLPIANPTQYPSSSATVYATVFDGTCYSDPVAVFLVVEQTPAPNSISIEMCDDGTGQATFDLWDYAEQISGGQGGVDWYLDAALTDQVPFPDAFLTISTTIYATVNSGLCISDPVEVVLNVIPSPMGNPTFLETCADSSGMGVFQLTAIEIEVSGGAGTVTWFEDAQGNIEITNPAMYVSSGTTVYALITVGTCTSDFIPVNLLIVNTVSASPATYALCDDGSGIGVFDLTDIELAVSSGTGQVNWFWDSAGTVVILAPDSVVTGDTLVFANVTAGNCVSDIVAVELVTLTSPAAMSTALQLCGDSLSQIVYDLTTLDSLVSGGIGLVTWYGDIMLSMEIPDPAAFYTGDTIVYAVVSIGTCTSQPATVVLFVAPDVTATTVTIRDCVPQGDTVFIDLMQYGQEISGGVGQVQWYADPLGTMPIGMPEQFPGVMSGTIYATVTAGICTSDVIPIPVELLTAPEAAAFSIQACGDISGQVAFDLTAADSIVSGNTGIVSWYGDPLLLMPIADPELFMSGDTVVFALVTNGFCIDGPVPVTLEVVDSLTANSTHLDVCAVNDTTVTLDLTLSEFAISGGNGTVHWFTDAQTMDTIPNPSAFETSGGTLYAVVTADGCVSNTATVTLEVFSASYPGLVCTYASVDSLAVTWTGIAPQYELMYVINGQMSGGPVLTSSEVFVLGGLGQGDTLTLWVTAVFDSVCSPLTSLITCITDVCPPLDLEFPDLQPEYCRNMDFVLLNAVPQGGVFSGQGVSGDTLYPTQVNAGSTIHYVWEDTLSGCVYESDFTISVLEPLSAPVVTCSTPTLSSVGFTWMGQASFGYQYRINQGPFTTPQMTEDAVLDIDGLLEGDSVTLLVWSAGPEPCGNSDTVMVTCTTKICPPVTISIEDPGPFCSEDEPVSMQVDISGTAGQESVVWSGPGIIDPSGLFDPAVAGPGSWEITVTVEENGCIDEATQNIGVFLMPVAAFEVSGTPCLDSTLNITFTGMAAANSEFFYDLDGGTLISGTMPLDFEVEWSGPGSYEISLLVEWNTCVSEPFSIPVEIDAPLDTPVIYCIEEDFNSLTIGWDPVPGADTYTVTSSRGLGILKENTYEITNLPDNTSVTVTVTAHSASACGPVSSEIACRTMEIIPLVSYVPNLFSPNADGINDILYIQGNSEILEVKTFRIFDRWGSVIFEDFDFLPNDAAHGWDGTYRGERLNPGVYVYYIELETTRGEPELLYGDVTLIR